VGVRGSADVYVASTFDAALSLPVLIAAPADTGSYGGTRRTAPVAGIAFQGAHPREVGSPTGGWVEACVAGEVASPENQRVCCRAGLCGDSPGGTRCRLHETLILKVTLREREKKGSNRTS